VDGKRMKLLTDAFKSLSVIKTPMTTPFLLACHNAPRIVVLIPKIKIEAVLLLTGTVRYVVLILDEKVYLW
jgi:hypothetical protein